LRQVRPIEEVEQGFLFRIRQKIEFLPSSLCAGAAMQAEKRSVQNG
jgi:hypothetical protein